MNGKVSGLNRHLVTLSLSGTPLLYDVNANTFLTENGANIPFKPQCEQPMPLYGSDGNIYLVKVLTNGEIYAPYTILNGICLSGMIRFLC